MSYKYKSILYWVLAFLLMAVVAVYQRMTGPTYPVRGKVSLEGQIIDYKLIRTFDGPGDAPVTVVAADPSINGAYRYKKFKSLDEWTGAPMVRKGDSLIAYLPHLGPAGKMMYEISLKKGEQALVLEKEPVVLRYKGHVPLWILMIHIVTIFLAMVFSTRTGAEALIKGPKTLTLAKWTTLFLFIGGIALGPVVQKYSFDAYWTGWPVGSDLTDNKTALALLAWIIAIFKLRRNPDNRIYAIVASVFLLAVFLIPHSVMGSEIDYTKTK